MVSQTDSLFKLLVNCFWVLVVHVSLLLAYMVILGFKVLIGTLHRLL
jgi:hypothetical protein